MEPNNKKILIAAIVIVAVVAVVAGYLSYSGNNVLNGTTQITDMAGRTVQIPTQINTVLATSPPSTNLVYMLAPDKLGGWNSNLTAEQKKYTPEKYQNLSVVGGWYSTFQGNPENFLTQKPDVVIFDKANLGNGTPSIDNMQQMMGSIPVVAMQSSINATNYAPSIQFMGKLLGAESSSNKLIAFYDKSLKTVNNTVSTIPQDQKVRVYYAEGAAGLQTDPEGSPHSQLISICGGVNVANVPIKEGNGMSNVNLEQVLQWNPDLIITNNPQFFKNIYTNSSWQNVKAVQDKKVYLAPTAPQGWFDRPPGVNTIIGIPWTAKVLYPDKFTSFNMTSLTKEFYQDFYHVTLTDDDVKVIMNNQTI
nr:ABC transporter substrate-binding protein [uncultured Methanobacterium sp.]